MADTYLKPVVRLLFHFMPFLGVMSGKWFLTAALFCLVFLAYVKARKIRAQIAACHDDELKRELQGAQSRWEYLTFD
jgi:hypothetical protein